jgi:sugar phosphate isomerase/epimerase
MFDIQTQLGVQSWCFRAFKTIPALLEQVHALGVSRLELCAVHADFNKPDTFAGVAKTIADAGVMISSFGVQYFDGKPEEENWFKCAKMAGISMIATSLDIGKMPDVLTKTVALAEKYEIKLGIHNHGGYDWLGSNKMLNHILEHTPHWVGSCLDTAWMIQSGEDPLKFADRWADRLYGVHIKDFTFGTNGRWTDVVVGMGNVKLPELMAIVTGKAAGSCKCVTLEYEGDIENPLPKLVECVEQIKRATA